jgi:transcriptional regulator with PAS, ATPase and Fis domain
MALRRRHDEETAQESPPAIALAQARIIAFWEGGSTSVTLPARGSIAFGRALECEVHIDHASVSRRHAVLHLGEELVLEDLGSANGTRVGARKLGARESARIAPGELIELGSAMFVVQAPGVSARGSTAARTQDHENGQPPITIKNGIVVRDPAMQQLHRLLTMVAPTSMSILVRGETGVGKEVVAQTIHRLSPRAAGPFLCLNCAAIPEALLESELFGHERGAFSGAVTAKPGLLETASRGTVFLDEIGEMPLPAQAKLLRAVETRQVTHVGGLHPIAFDVRFIAATNRDLEAVAARGAFRQDLYFRLNGISIQVPPLRERIAEILPLAQHFAACAAGEMGVPLVAISEEVIDVLERYAWPGNIRELRNVMEQAVVFSRGKTAIRVDHLPTEVRQTPTPIPSAPPAPTNTLRGELEALERRRIVDALERCSGNQTRAARLLGISRRTLVSRLAVHGLPRPRKG